jgi:hypothetical protein
MSKYDETAVDQAIRASRKPIGRKEGRMIHALLKGSTGYASRTKANADEDRAK